MDPRFASRKFLLAAFCVVYGAACNAFGVEADAQWLSFLTWIVGLYITGNVGAALVVKATAAMAASASDTGSKA